jgi:hypothetical protein
MHKPVLCVVVVLLGGVWARAQQPQPGYAFLTSGQNSAGTSIIAPSIAAPPEPAIAGASPPMGMPPAGMSGPAGGLPPTGIAGYPFGAGPEPMYGAGVAPSFGFDPPSSFGTETFWLKADYITGWFTRPTLNTPLVTQGSTADPRPGALGQPSTVVLFGDEQYRFNQLHGMQAELGVNLNDRLYLEFRGMVFWPTHTRAVFSSDSTGSPFISRPVFNTLSGDERSYRTSTPGLIAGSTAIEARQQIFGFEANARYNVKLTPYLDVDALIGYRRMQLEEDLTITDQLIPIGGSFNFQGTTVSFPNTVDDYDRFAATNQFNGINLGTRFRWQSGYEWFAMTGYGKLALGATRQTMAIDGASSALTDSGPVTLPGGILALSSNIGHHSRTVFGVIPEGGAGIVFLPTRHLRLHAGYSAMYWNNVIRPGSSLDPRVNPALVPTDTNFGSGNPGAFPAFSFKSESVWLQTLNFGLELYY